MNVTDEVGEVGDGLLGSRILCRYCRNSAEGAPDGPQAGSTNRSMPVRVSYGRATCAGHKQECVKSKPRNLSPHIRNKMHSLAWLGQGLCPAQHAISMSCGPPTTPTTAAPRRRGSGSPGGSVERAVVATGRRQVAPFSGAKLVLPRKHFRRHFFNCCEQCKIFKSGL